MSGFKNFYNQHFLAEHMDSRNVFLHIVGVLLGLSLFPLAAFFEQWLLILLFPAAHGAPSLLGHRLFERNLVVGDLRVTRKDFPFFWFIAANHLMAWRVLTFQNKSLT
jgi:hypothetical protein